jgi:hypothetical protein
MSSGFRRVVRLGVRGFLDVSFWLSGRLFDISRAAFIAKCQRVIFGDTRRYSATT